MLPNGVKALLFSEESDVLSEEVKKLVMDYFRLVEGPTEALRWSYSIKRHKIYKRDLSLKTS